MSSAPAASTNSLVWQTAPGRISADIRGEALWPLLTNIAHKFEQGIRETIRWYLDHQDWVKAVLKKP